MLVVLTQIFILSVSARAQLSVARSGHDGHCKTFSGEAGACKEERDCPEVMEGRYFPSLCSISGSKKVGVCCKATKQTPPPEVRCGIMSFTITESDPGQFLNPRVAVPSASPETREIVNGERTAMAGQPWTAALGSPQPGTDLVKFLCGGSLVSASTVLTSAHCLDHLGPSPVVLLGQTDLAREEAGAQVRTVHSSLVHPDWSGSPNNDLALLHLDRPVTLSDRVSPVCLPSGSLTSTHGLISGWGRVYSGGPAVSELRTGEVEILSEGECQQAFPHLARTGGLLCARGLQSARSDLVTDACQGDSGGPLVTEDDLTGQWRLTGVVTAGRGCGYSQHPGVYVSVSHHLAWIQRNIQ